MSQNSSKMGVPLQAYTLNQAISVVKYKFWQQQYIMIIDQYKTK